MKISAAIITFNEEKRLPRALGSVEWADEIVVVDSGSTDNTRKIAMDAGAKVFEQPWLGFGKQKQFAAGQCGNDWILSVDADEWVPDRLKDELLAIRDAKAGPSADGYRIPRLTYYSGRPIRHGGWYPDRQLRFFDRTKGKWSDSIVHESVRMSRGSTVKKLKNDLLHDSGLGPLTNHKMIGERYAPLAAEQMHKKGLTTSPLRIMTTGMITFLHLYVVKGGFLDGFPGYCIARGAAQNSFLKHFLLWKKQFDPED